MAIKIGDRWAWLGRASVIFWQRAIGKLSPDNPKGRRGQFRLGNLVLLMAILLACSTPATWAQTESDEPTNPFESTEPDPLLPQPPVERPLSPLERLRLTEALEELNQQAAAQLRQGNTERAFEIWYREIRLRRVLGGPIEEVRALGRVGAIAWEGNHKPQVQLITNRLETIQQEAEENEALDLPLLRALGEAYAQVRVPGQALAIYEQILADAREEGDREEQEEILETMARLHLAWFDYPQAAATYEELLALAQARGDRVSELAYLQELIEIYDQAKQPENALQFKQRLAQTYTNENNLAQLPALKIAIAEDYEALDRLDEASQTYQEAYTLAWSQQQYAYAGDALGKLANLYLENDQPVYALQVYEVLLQVEQQSYDFYGLMNAYDQIGQIHLEQRNYDRALSAFQRGLELAQSLQYQENYFATQIERVNRQGSQ
jgi:tetratricopeptide (TPR) repeat protein